MVLEKSVIRDICRLTTLLDRIFENNKNQDITVIDKGNGFFLLQYELDSTTTYHTTFEIMEQLTSVVDKLTLLIWLLQPVTGVGLS